MKIREFILQKIYSFRKPMTNYQIPQTALLKYRSHGDGLRFGQPRAVSGLLGGRDTDGPWPLQVLLPVPAGQRKSDSQGDPGRVCGDAEQDLLVLLPLLPGAAHEGAGEAKAARTLGEGDV